MSDSIGGAGLCYVDQDGHFDCLEPVAGTEVPTDAVPVSQAGTGGGVGVGLGALMAVLALGAAWVHRRRKA